MKRSSGFTIIELIITMVVMVILMSLAVINLRSTQANARDAERASDIATIARGLEQRYNQGIAKGSDGSQITLTTTIHVGGSSWTACGGRSPGLNAGSYPSTQEVVYAQGNADSNFCPNQAPAGFLQDDLPGTDSHSFKAPNSGTLKMATSNAVPLSISAGDNNYYYQPLDSSNNLCNSTATLSNPCVKFNLYYQTETKGLQTVGSKHQQ